MSSMLHAITTSTTFERCPGVDQQARPSAWHEARVASLVTCAWRTCGAHATTCRDTPLFLETYLQEHPVLDLRPVALPHRRILDDAMVADYPSVGRSEAST